MKQGDVEVLVKAFAPVIRELVIRAVKPIAERLRYLEAREPAKGEPGEPGLGFDDLDVGVLDDDRTIELAFRRGGEEKVFTLKWPTVIDRGVYRAGDTYQPGDAVSWGGSLWIAQKQTDAKPDTPESGWRLAVKRGRDGKDAKVG